LHSSLFFFRTSNGDLTAFFLRLPFSKHTLTFTHTHTYTKSFFLGDDVSCSWAKSFKLINFFDRTFLVSNIVKMFCHLFFIYKFLVTLREITFIAKEKALIRPICSNKNASLLVNIYAEVESLRARFPGIWTGPP
jgi:hypothetical protein